MIQVAVTLTQTSYEKRIAQRNTRLGNAMKTNKLLNSSLHFKIIFCPLVQAQHDGRDITKYGGTQKS